MSTFELSQQTAKLLHINPRTEKHGDEEVPAADLRIELQTVDVDKFRCALMEGGSVGLVFRIKAQPTGEQIKKLYEVLGSEITLTVVPAIEKQGSLGLPVEA